MGTPKTSDAMLSGGNLPLNHVIPIAGVWQKRKASFVPALRARINRKNGAVVLTVTYMRRVIFLPNRV